MKILAIDTSATAASVALIEDKKLIGEFFINARITHSQTLVPMIDSLLENSQSNINDIDYVAVNTGPGSFTGVRIGVAAGKGIAFAEDKKCVAVSTLLSMAYNLLDNDCVICSVMDARCSQVYNALFKCSNGKITRVTEDRALAIADLKNELEDINEKIILVGDGAELCFEAMSDNFNIALASANNRFQRASSTALAAYKLVESGNVLTSEEIMPTYLRLPQAQRELNKKLGGKL